MYILYTRAGIVVADSAALAGEAISRIGLAVTNGEAAALGVEYGNGVAKTYDLFDNLKTPAEIAAALTSGDYENAARSATGVAIGTIAAEIVTASVLAGVGGAVMLAALPILAVGTGIAFGYAAEEAWNALHDVAESITEDDVAEAFDDLANRFLNFFLPNGMRPVDRGVNISYGAARSWRTPRGDPLTLDLDGDGIETTALSATNPILFDLNADGVKTGTGWIKPDDGLLVLDRNGNGLIDDGRELFGDATPLSGGGTAHDGLAALADLDANRDGRIDAADARFAQLRVWRDLDQDGVSQSNELASLASLGIQSIDLTRTANTTNLANGNQIADQASFLKTDDTTGGIGSLADVNLAGNPFYSDFTDTLDTSAVSGLPDMQGAGMVRDLKEAASLSGGLAGTLAAYAGATTREQQMALLDGLLAAWADTSTMDTSVKQAATNGMKLIYLAPGETIQDAVQIDNMAGEPGELSPAEAARRAELKAKQEHLTALIGLLEKYNGQTFVTVNAHSVTTGTGAEVIGVTTVGTYETGFPLAAVSLSQAQADLLEQSYSELKQSLYQGLVLQTRLKPYLDDVGLVIDESGLRADFAGVEQGLDARFGADRTQAANDSQWAVAA